MFYAQFSTSKEMLINRIPKYLSYIDKNLMQMRSHHENSVVIYIYPNMTEFKGNDTYDNDILGNFVCFLEKNDNMKSHARTAAVDIFHRLRTNGTTRIQMNVHECKMACKRQVEYKDCVYTGIYMGDTFHKVWCINKDITKRFELNLSNLD